MQNTITNIDKQRFTPFTVGFDDLFDRLFDMEVNTSSGYPPYNIIKSDANRRVDFLFSHPFIGTIVIEIDGEEHKNSSADIERDRELDRARERDVARKNIQTEKAPSTADAMKRYKAGKAGFTDKAHLKAKGLIPRADGTKRKSDKYK